MSKSKNIDLSIPRRRYFNNECELTICPECGSDLIEESCTILLHAKSDSDDGQFMTNLSGSHFCNKCPVVVFDLEKVERGAMLGIRGSKNLKYAIEGIIDLDSIPTNKRHLEMGTDNNPIPLVQFLPGPNDEVVNKPINKPITSEKKAGRNEPCPCGSGKKYKKCCGK